jgi:WXXGXW repeat (2 copies)
MITGNRKLLRYGLGLGLLGVTGVLLGGCNTTGGIASATWWPWSNSEDAPNTQEASANPDALANISPQAGTPSSGPPISAGPPTTQVVAAPMAPPPGRNETAPPAPGPGMAWVPGYWNFGGANWVWVSGHYETPPRPTAQWTPGHWTPQSGGGGVWVWVAGRWT